MQPHSFAPRQTTLADQSPSEERARFISRTYTHLFGAITALILIEAALLATPFSNTLVEFMLSFAGGYSWLVVLAAFMGVSYLANSWAQDSTSTGIQYAGLSLYVVAQAVLLLPLLYIAVHYSSPEVVPAAGIVTLCAFTGLTAVVVITRKNFSFLGPFLGVAGLAALGFIVCSILFGFSLGILFTALMVVFACGYILYDTSRVMHEYHTDQHVAAALALFASVVLLFWYVLRLFMSRR